jgi:hypothetical protein
MRVLRLTMIGVSTLLVLLSGVVWYQGLTVVDYTVGQSIGLHFQGHRMYYLQVRGCLVAAFWFACPCGACSLVHPTFGLCGWCALLCDAVCEMCTLPLYVCDQEPDHQRDFYVSQPCASCLPTPRNSVSM